MTETAQHTKARIAQHFSRAAASYAESAHLQSRIARQLLGMIPEHQVDSLADLGCGSGSELPLLASQYPGAAVLGLDLCNEMLRQANNRYGCNYRLLAADIETLPLTSASMDLLFSSLAMQWCSSLGVVLQQCQRVLAPGGLLALSTMAEGSLSELASAWQAVDGFAHTNQYPSGRQHYQTLLGSDLELLQYRYRQEEIFFADFSDLLRNMKQTGVNTVLGHARQGLLTPGQLRRIEARYEQFRQPEGIPMRYRVVYAIMRKPE